MSRHIACMYAIDFESLKLCKYASQLNGTKSSDHAGRCLRVVQQLDVSGRLQLHLRQLLHAGPEQQMLQPLLPPWADGTPHPQPLPHCCLHRQPTMLKWMSG